MILRYLWSISKVVRPVNISDHLKEFNKINKFTHFNKLYSTATMPDIIFRQLLDYDTFTYTYILGDSVSREAVIIDPVFERVERDAQLLKELDLNPLYALNTHMHADHITGTGKLCTDFFKHCKSAVSEGAGADATHLLSDREVLKFGDFHLECLATPGHTSGCMTFVLKEKGWVFTGDALFHRGCGRTDFQQGSSETLYRSVHDKIFPLPEQYLIYPGHDYNGHMATSVGEEKKYNPRLTKSIQEFTNIMENLNLDKPKFIDVAIPANIKDGLP